MSVATNGAESTSARRRRPTSTASFGSSRRESHDASAFYGRFVPPELSLDATVVRPARVDVIYGYDARDMSAVESNSVALVVTSPPYFAGKDYERSVGGYGVPSTYFDYLGLLRDVFAECKRVLEPGGRIAVNVANLGRRPYRSLAGDVTEILQDLGLLLRGEVVWWKGRAAGGSCTWGSFQQPANPVLRDITERVVIASKGRFDRAIGRKERHRLGLPSTATIARDEFLEATTDLWDIPPESATRVGHPAPFPIELPRRLIDLYTYEEDVILDPFLGSGTTAVAAMRSRRHFIGYDNDPDYVRLARQRVQAEQERRPLQFDLAVRIPAVADSESPGGKGGRSGKSGGSNPAAPATASGRSGSVGQEPAVPGAGTPALSRALQAGSQAKEVAAMLLEESGFTRIRSGVKVPASGVEVSFTAADAAGQDWMFELAGSFSSGRTGLRRADVLWRALGKAAVLHARSPRQPLVLFTTDMPARGSPGRVALDLVKGPELPVSDVVELLDPSAIQRLQGYATGGYPA
jgi:DNA modification methylase